jgi:hypothetical protein
MVYKGVGEYECESCGNIEYDDYGVVRNYIEKHRGATVVEISSATGISQNTINMLLREERLQVANNSRVFLKCAACGKDIVSGQYCTECAGLVAAAQRRKMAKLENHKHNYIGIDNSLHKGQNGARRFKRDDDSR